MKKMLVAMVLFICAGLLALPPVMAMDYYCEVMTLKGSAFVTSADSLRKPVKEGDLLKAGDLLEVDKDSQVDLAFDKDWNNVTRIWESSKIKIKSIYPTGLNLSRGDVFSKLDKLPRGTTFEIQTPTAVAAVRGTEFLTSVSEQGQTSVVSYEHSVEVFSLDKAGMLGDRVLVEASQKTIVPQINEPPSPPAEAPESDMQKIAGLSTDIEQHTKEMVQEGRFAQIQSAGSVEAMMKLAEIYKSTEVGQGEDNKESSSDDRKPADNNGGGPGGPGGGPGGDLSSAQMQQMKDRFVQMGGSTGDFDKMQEHLRESGITAANFDKVNTAATNFIDRPGAWTPGAMNDSLVRNEQAVPSSSFRDAPLPGAAFDPSKMENNLPFHGDAPPSIQQMENQLNRTLTAVEQNQLTTCATDPSKCAPPPTGTHIDGSPCTSIHPC